MFTFTLRLCIDFSYVLNCNHCVYIVMQDNMYQTMSISSGLYPELDLWKADNLQLRGTTCR